MAYQHFNRKERGKLALLLNQKHSLREIASKLGRNVSSISREIKRNKGENSYKAETAHKKYQQRLKHSHKKRLYKESDLCKYVCEKLLLAWSPEQISGRLKAEKSKMKVSFSSIYRWLDLGLLPRTVELKPYLRRFRKRKKPKKVTSRADARSIKKRAESVLRRNRYGHWEVDTMSFNCFPNQTYLLNINERKSRYCVLICLPNIKRESVLNAFKSVFEGSNLPLKTMTSDRGMEFNCHNQFEEIFNVPFYYTDKASPWQKPTVENTNGLIRQFLPRGTDIKNISPDFISNIMLNLNNRPRKSLNFKSPAQVLHLR